MNFKEWEEDLSKKLNKEYEEYYKSNDLEECRETFVGWWNTKFKDSIAKYPKLKMTV